MVSNNIKKSILYLKKKKLNYTKFNFSFGGVQIEKIKLPKKKSIKSIKKFFKENGLKFYLIQKANQIKRDMRFEKNTYKPELQDLYRLHRLIILNKRISVLEYGTGWSSLVISNALD